MCLFRRKKKTEEDKIKDNIVDIKSNVIKLKVICDICENEEALKALKGFLDQMEYTSPSTAEAIRKLDVKISNKLDDIKIVVVSSKQQNERLMDLIHDLKLLVSERCRTVEVR